MHYQSDIAGIHDKLWTYGELERWLRERFRTSLPLTPDDAFYGKVRNKDELHALADVITRHLHIKNTVSIELSDRVPLPGSISYENNTLYLVCPVTYIGSPLRAAAGLAHLLAHGVILTGKRLHIDPGENERLADIACIQAGLGLVVINGADKGGWRTIFYRKSLRRSPMIGYYSLKQFILQTQRFFEQRGTPQTRFLNYVVPWHRSKFPRRKKAGRRHMPNSITNAFIAHNRSIRTFIVLSTFLLLLSLTGGYVLTRTPLGFGVDRQLTHLRQSANELKLAHEQCADRYQNLKSTLPMDQISSVRLLSYEQTRCKSLENRYNTAVVQYNSYLNSRR